MRAFSGAPGASPGPETLGHPWPADLSQATSERARLARRSRAIWSATALVVRFSRRARSKISVSGAAID